MATTRNIIAEQILRRLEYEGQSKDARYDIREIKREIDNVANLLLKMEYYNERNMGERGNVDHAVATYNAIAISLDAVSGKNYALLPVRPMRLPKSRGIVRVAPTSTIGSAMIPLYSGGR